MLNHNIYQHLCWGEPKTPRTRYQHDLIKNKLLLKAQHETLFFHLIKQANILLWKIKYLPIVVRVNFFRIRFFEVRDSFALKTTTRGDSIYLSSSKRISFTLKGGVRTSSRSFSRWQQSKGNVAINISFHTPVLFRNFARFPWQYEQSGITRNRGVC